MSVLTDLIYGGSNAVAGLTESAVNDAIAKHGADKEIAFPDTAYFFPTIYAATGVKVKTGRPARLRGCAEKPDHQSGGSGSGAERRPCHRCGRRDHRGSEICERRRPLCG